MEQLIKAATLLKDEAAKQDWNVLGIGLGTPGIVDETNRIVLGGAENIIGWENIDVASLMEKQMSLPVVVGNDANLMGLGETKYGAGRGCTHVVFLTVEPVSAELSLLMASCSMDMLTGVRSWGMYR